MDKTQFQLTDGGETKKFVVTKMSALQASNWSIKLASLGCNAFGQGAMEMDSDAVLKALSVMDSEKASMLRKELRETVSIVTSVGEFQLDDVMLNQHIKEFQNVFLIEAEAFKANFGFFIVGGGLKSLIASLTKTIRYDTNPQNS